MIEDSWLNTLREQRSKLNQVSDWATAVNYSAVRDLCRRAIAEMENHIEHREEQIQLAATNRIVDP